MLCTLGQNSYLCRKTSKNSYCSMFMYCIAKVLSSPQSILDCLLVDWLRLWLVLLHFLFVDISWERSLEKKLPLQYYSSRHFPRCSVVANCYCTGQVSSCLLRVPVCVSNILWSSAASCSHQVNILWVIRQHLSVNGNVPSRHVCDVWSCLTRSYKTQGEHDF